MKNNTYLGLACLLTLSACGAAAPIERAPRAAELARSDESVFSCDGLEVKTGILTLVNKERAQANLKPLVLTETLNKMAQSYADDMFHRNYFAHTDPDGRGLGERLKIFRVAFAAAGENIALGQASCADVMDSWMHSPGHRSNILSPAFEGLGVGYSASYWVQDFTGSTSPTYRY